MNAANTYAELNIEGERCQIRGYQRWHTGRDQIELFIARKFDAEYGAQLTHFMPLLVVLENSQGEVLAIAGVRSAVMEPLFLEYYLDAPVEHSLQQHSRSPIPRHHIVEMGNLAAVQAGYARYLFAVMTDLLLAWQFEWLCCTGVTGVRNLFRRLDMDPTVLAPALADRLPDAAAQWGNYYQRNPQVLTGEIRRGRAAVERSGILASCGYARLEMADVQSA